MGRKGVGDLYNRGKDYGKDPVKASDATEDFISKHGIVLDGDHKKFAEWYLEMTKDLEPFDDIEDDDN